MQPQRRDIYERRRFAAELNLHSVYDASPKISLLCDSQNKKKTYTFSKKEKLRRTTKDPLTPKPIAYPIHNFKANLTTTRQHVISAAITNSGLRFPVGGHLAAVEDSGVCILFFRVSVTVFS